MGKCVIVLLAYCILALSSHFNTEAQEQEYRPPRLRHSKHQDTRVIEYSVSNLPSTPADVTKFSVKDNHKPMFVDCSNYNPTVEEEAPKGTYVFTINAVDRDPPDRGGTVTYKFVSSPTEKERFYVDPNTGVITTADIFDHDEPSRETEFYVTVRASDNGRPQLDDACTFKINIKDINDNQPVFDKVSYSESVPQDLLVDREVMKISATDIDEGNNSVVRYSLDANSPDYQYFTIDRDYGVVLLSKSIDKPIGYRFKLSAIVKDMGEPPQQSSIILDITVVESQKKRPTFVEVPSEPIVLDENYADFTKPIAIIRADSNTPEETKVQFELVKGQTEQTNKLNTFVLETEKDFAYIKLGRHLDYERNTDYVLTVRIQNNYRLAAEIIIIINIRDVNDNIPTFGEIRSGTVLENEPPGTQVMQVRAFDADGTSAHNQITYAIADSNDEFAIDPITGNITTLKQFDREEKSFYNVKLIATDNSESSLIPGKHNSGQQVFQIEIADKNDNPPRFTNRTYVAEGIPENAIKNELVTVINAVDIDDASVVTYNIVSGNIGNAFVIKNASGEIRVNGRLDYEKITSYLLDVRAFDGRYEDFAQVLIKIENVNDNPPVFLANYSKTIEEERLYEGCIVKVEAYDPDILDRSLPQDIIYNIVKTEQKEFLSIDNDGCLRLTKPLNRDQPTGFVEWQILIIASDNGGGKVGMESLSSTTEVNLELTDINDNEPFLTNVQPVVWYENESPGFIVNLTAKDYDGPNNGPPFTFTISRSATSQIHAQFSIQGNSLYTHVSLDREANKEYLIAIDIRDSGSPPLTGSRFLHLIVGDRNDNPMGPGQSRVFVYSYRGQAPDTEVGRIYVNDLDDWDLPDKRFYWLPSFELKSQFFSINMRTGMITMKGGTPSNTYTLNFNVTEESKVVPFHWVEAVVTVTVKEIPEEAVDKSGSIRFVNVTAERFIIPESDGTSKREKLHKALTKLFNVSEENVDVFTVAASERYTGDGNTYLDVRFSAHGSPYYSPEKLNTMVTEDQRKLEMTLNVQIYMISIDECMVEKQYCEDSCRNQLYKSNAPQAVYTNTTSFIGVTARVDPICSCEENSSLVCLNGGTPFADKCECPDGLVGPQCEQTAVGFHGDGWAMYPPPPACSEIIISFNLIAYTKDSLVFYLGPQTRNKLNNFSDFMSMELVDGYIVLTVNYGSGTARLNNSVIQVADGKPHVVQITLMKTSIEMIVDHCQMLTCRSLTAPTGTNEILNVNAPLQLGGTKMDLAALGKELGWTHMPKNVPFIGCINNFTYNGHFYNLGEPSYHKNADPSCQRKMMQSAKYQFTTNFLYAILCCFVLFIVLLLAVVVYRRSQDQWSEKGLDDIRENIIAYEDEGGGEGDAGFDLQVLRQIFDGPPPDPDGYVQHPGLCAGVPKLSGFLEDKKFILDRNADVYPLDDARHYAYEGDGNSIGSLSSLASLGTDDEDINFNHITTFGPRFRKLADMYVDSDEERAPLEESWC